MHALPRTCLASTTGSRPRSHAARAFHYTSSAVCTASSEKHIHQTLQSAALSNLQEFDVPSRRHAFLQLASLALGAAVLAPMHASHTAPAWAGDSSLRPLTKAEQQAVTNALKATMSKAKAPLMLRLVFHDAGTYSVASGDGGLNASIRFELDRADNFGLKRGWRVIEQLVAKLRDGPAAGLSSADLIALAGAHAVALTSGPSIPVRVGRRDADRADADGRLPEMTFSSAQQKACFARMGFSAKEFVALMGSHTIGSKGFGAPDKFDNVYYTTLLQRPWTNTKDEMASMIGLPSDHVLPDDTELEPFIQEYANNEALFYDDFTRAYVKLSELGA